MKIPKLISLQCEYPYTIIVKFDDGVSGKINCKPKNTSSVFNKLLDKDFFMSGKIDSKHNTIVWDETLDIDGLGCYLELTGKDFNSLYNT